MNPKKIRINKKKRIVLAMAAVIALVAVCTKDEEGMKTIVRGGMYSVSLYRFQEDYFHYLQFRDETDSDSLRYEYAKNMLFKEYISDSLKKAGMDFDTAGNLFYRAAKSKYATDYLFKKTIVPLTPEFSEEDLRREYALDKKRFHVWQIYSPKKENIEKCMARLNEGSEFAHATGNFGAVFRNLGWVRRGDLDPLLEKALFKLQPGSFSPPVRTIYGWHILRLVNIKKELIAKEYDYQVRKTKLKSRARRILSYEYASRLIIDSLLSKDLKIHEEGLNILKKMMEAYGNQTISKIGEESEFSIEDYMDAQVVIASGPRFDLTVAECFDHWANVPGKIRESSLKKTLKYLVKERFLYEKALDLSAMESPEVKESLKQYKANYFYNMYVKKIGDEEITGKNRTVGSEKGESRGLYIEGFIKNASSFTQAKRYINSMPSLVENGPDMEFVAETIYIEKRYGSFWKKILQQGIPRLKEGEAYGPVSWEGGHFVFFPTKLVKATAKKIKNRKKTSFKERLANNVNERELQFRQEVKIYLDTALIKNTSLNKFF